MLFSSVLISSSFYQVLLWTVAVDARTLSMSHINPTGVKHFESELDPNLGYWSPSTSSIDWCERNYVITSYIAEFWNCISSFSMCILGGILFVRGLCNRVETRFLMSSLGLAFVGLGSAYFHGTLTHLGQMADELPMVYSMIIWWYILLKMDDFADVDRKIFRFNKYVLFGIFYACLWTYVHSLQSFVLIFQAHMGLMVVVGITKLIRLYQEKYIHYHRLKLILIVYVTAVVLAFILWILDQQFCAQFNTNSLFNPQLHAWWHIIGAIHCHLGIVCGEYIRIVSIEYRDHQRLANKKPEPFNPENNANIIYSFGLPFVHYLKDNRNVGSTKRQ